MGGELVANLVAGWLQGEPIPYQVGSILNSDYILPEPLSPMVGVRIESLPLSTNRLSGYLPLIGNRSPTQYLGRMVLTMDHSASPALFRPGDQRSVRAERATGASGARDEVVCQALALAADAFVDVAFSWLDYGDHLGVFGLGSGEFTWSTPPAHFRSTFKNSYLGTGAAGVTLKFEETPKIEVDGERLRVVLAALAESSAGRLQIAASRWLRSKDTSSPLEDRFIDLRIALERDTTYHFQLRGVNPAGHGPTSRQISVNTTRIVRSPVVTPAWPAAPTGLTAERGDGKVALAWGDYNHIDNALAGWEVSSNDGVNWSDTGLGGDARAYTVAGLTNGTAYTFKVRPILGPSIGSPSGGVEATPRRYTNPPVPVPNIRVTHNGTSLTVSWDAAARATSYNVTYRGNGANARGAWDHTATSLTITCDSRYPGQDQNCVAADASYVVGVQPVNAGGTGYWRNSAPAAYGAPEQPGNDCDLRLSGDGQVSGSWAEGCGSTARSGRDARYYSFTLATRSLVTFDLTSDVDTYLYLRSGDGRSRAILHRNDDYRGRGLNSSIRETLDAGTYTVEATTYHAGATGDFTLDASGIAAETDPPEQDPPQQTPPGQNPNPPTTAPGPVTNISVTHNGTSLTVSWTAPAGATHYDVTYWNQTDRVNARAAWNHADSSASPTLTITCDSRTGSEGQNCVESGDTYTVGVRARNAIGEGDWRNSAAASE